MMKEPLGYHDDTPTATQALKFGESYWFNQLSQEDIGYNWALINTFSKYFGIAVPFINCSNRIQECER